MNISTKQTTHVNVRFWITIKTYLTFWTDKTTHVLNNSNDRKFHLSTKICLFSDILQCNLLNSRKEAIGNTAIALSIVDKQCRWESWFTYYDNSKISCDIRSWSFYSMGPSRCPKIDTVLSQHWKFQRTFNFYNKHIKDRKAKNAILAELLPKQHRLYH